MSVQTAEVVESASPATLPHHRGDIQGLRALAVTAVVAYHAGISKLSGGFVGVDLFFVLSGFLITELLIRETTKKGSISLLGFWARRARRLLPAATVVLVATTIATALFMPVLERAQIARDILFSSIFAGNWRFAQQQTDYLAQDRQDSPVLHFWSLGVEEQFYLAWPLMVVACAFIAHRLWRHHTRFDTHLRLTIASVALLIAVLSFIYSVHETVANQPFAFFGTPSRAWQLAVGALLACVAPFIGRLSRQIRTLFAVIGLGGFATAIFVLKESSSGLPYPGTAALLPTLSAALLIAAGTSRDETLIGKGLSFGPLQWIGDLSYSLYLWHFPVLIIGISYLEPAGWLVRCVLVAFALLCSWVSYKYLETPIRTLPRLARRPSLSLAMGAVLIAITATTAVASIHAIPPPTTGIINEVGKRITIEPALGTALHFKTAYGDDCMLNYEQVKADPCDYGDLKSDKRVVLLGDSHSGPLFKPLKLAAEKAGWHLNMWSKQGCDIADVTVYDNSRKRLFSECDIYRKDAFKRTLAAKPDLVVLATAFNTNKLVFDRATGKRLNIPRSRQAIRDGMRKTVTTFTDRGINVVVVVDLPGAPFKPEQCLADTKDARKCTFKPTKVPGPEKYSVDGVPHTRLVTFAEDFCTPKVCNTVLGNLGIYRDSNHITEAYALTLQPRFDKVLRETPTDNR